MNKTVERAYEINKFCDWECDDLPELEIGDICTISDVWDGEGEEPESDYCYKITDSGEDGEENYDIWINYVWEVIEKKEDYFDTKIKITKIELI